MEELKNLFGEETLSYEQFAEKLNTADDLKLVNMKSKDNGYVAKEKLDKVLHSYNELKTKYSALLDETATHAKDLEELQAMRVEKDNADKLEKIRQAKIDDKFAKFALSEIKNSTKENEKFEDVLAKFVKENPQYLTSRQGVFAFGASSPNLEQGNNANTESTNSIMNKIFRSK